MDTDSLCISKEKLERLIDDMESDSRSKSEEAEEELCSLSYDMMIRIKKIYRSYGFSELYYPLKFGYDIQGSCEFGNYDWDERKLYMTFEDNWQYGGHSEGYAAFPIDLLIHYDESRLERKCQSIQLSHAKSNMEGDQKQLDRSTKRYMELLAKIEG